VYQKPFVEFFASEAVVDKLEDAVGTMKGVVDFLAGNRAVRPNYLPPLRSTWFFLSSEGRTQDQRAGHWAERGDVGRLSRARDRPIDDNWTGIFPNVEGTYHRSVQIHPGMTNDIL
jgi:hypothetical protein